MKSQETHFSSKTTSKVPPTCVKFYAISLLCHQFSSGISRLAWRMCMRYQLHVCAAKLFTLFYVGCNNIKHFSKQLAFGFFRLKKVLKSEWKICCFFYVVEKIGKFWESINIFLPQVCKGICIEAGFKRSLTLEMFVCLSTWRKFQWKCSNRSLKTSKMFFNQFYSILTEIIFSGLTKCSVYKVFNAKQVLQA